MQLSGHRPPDWVPDVELIRSLKPDLEGQCQPGVKRVWGKVSRCDHQDQLLTKQLMCIILYHVGL